MVKNLPANAGDTTDAGSIPGLGRSPGEGNENPLQYSCLENTMDRVALVSYSPWGCKASDTSGQLSTQLKKKQNQKQHTGFQRLSVKKEWEWYP